MKKAVSIALVIAGLGFSTIFAAYFFAGKPLLGTNFASGPTASAAPTIAVLDEAEVAKHSTANDCWIIINNKVYNVTNFLRRHPGGSGEIIPFCGKDATQGFMTQGGRSTDGHSSFAEETMATLYVGDLQ